MSNVHQPPTLLVSRLAEAYRRMETECRYRPAAYADGMTGQLDPIQDSPAEEASRWILGWIRDTEPALERALHGSASLEHRHITAVLAEAVNATHGGQLAIAQSLALLAARLLEEEAR